MAMTNSIPKLNSGKERVYRLFHCTPEQHDSFSMLSVLREKMRPRPIVEGEQENLREKREYEDVTSEFKLIFRLMEKKGNRTGDR